MYGLVLQKYGLRLENPTPSQLEGHTKPSRYIVAPNYWAQVHLVRDGDPHCHLAGEYAARARRDIPPGALVAFAGTARHEAPGADGAHRPGFAVQLDATIARRGASPKMS